MAVEGDLGSKGGGGSHRLLDCVGGAGVGVSAHLVLPPKDTEFLAALVQFVKLPNGSHHSRLEGRREDSEIP